MSEFTYIGVRTKKYDASERVTGRAVFGADFALAGTLHGKVLRSPYPHARIKHIDPRKALALEGVKAAVTFADLPRLKNPKEIMGGELLITMGELQRLILANEKVLWEGHPVAAVAATSPFIAQEALKLIDVEYEELPFVEDVLTAMKPDAPLLYEDMRTHMLGKPEPIEERPSNVTQKIEVGRGGVEKCFREADVIVEYTYRTAMVHQGYIEPQASTAVWDPDGKLTVWTTTQGHFPIQRQLALILDMPLSRIRVVPLEIGGAFGGKILMILEPLAALLAKKSGRPVKMVMTREEVLKATGPASPCVITLKTGARRDGKLTALSAKLIFDAGCAPGSPVGAGVITGMAPYQVESFHIEGYDVVTNKPRVQAYRAPGAPQTAFAFEQQIDATALAIGMDPLEFRLKNASRSGDLDPSGKPFPPIGLTELLETIRKHPAWTSLLGGKHRGRGLAVGYWMGAAGGHSTAEVTCNSDGSISLVLGCVDLTGTRTTMQQVCAEELQVPLDLVYVSVGDTETIGYSGVSAGSRVTYTLSTAVHNACQGAVKQLMARAAEHLKVPVEDVERVNGLYRSKSQPDKKIDYFTLMSSSFRRYGPVMSSGFVGSMKGAPAFSAGVVDVEVDPETGKTRVLRYTAFQDVGRAINPTQVEGQMQGGAAQGLGWALSEEYVYDQGRLRNATLLDYRMPTALDVPFIDTVMVEVPSGDGLHGVRGVGEAPIIPPPAAVANALHRAIGVRVTELPLDPENVLNAVKKAAGEKERAARLHPD